MPEPTPNVALLRSLARLVRGLSALFWGLPAALLICVQAARTDWLKSFGIIPPLVATSLVAYGLLQLGHFQRQERIWRGALDRAQLLSLVVASLSPFLYWWNKVPNELFFGIAVGVDLLAGLALLWQLNVVLLRLGAMLPDETLRQETRLFTALNRGLLAVALLLALLVLAVTIFGYPVSLTLALLVAYLEHYGLWLLIGLVLLPLAMTMALIWKTKEVILESVFHPES